MSNATMTNAATAATIRADEAAHFGRMAAEWWDPAGSSAMLHKLNPVRLGFIRAAIEPSGWMMEFGSDQREGTWIKVAPR